METKTYEVPGHCGYKNGARITVNENDKKGFVCEICKQAFEIDYDGNITSLPLSGANLSRIGTIYECGIKPSTPYHEVENCK